MASTALAVVELPLASFSMMLLDRCWFVHTVDYNPPLKSQLAQRKLTFRPFPVTYHADSGGPETFVVHPVDRSL